jgi:hypothetical protein
MKFSRVLAIVFGLLAPAAETVRRWNTWRADPPSLLDDYVMGAMLLWGAWSAGRGMPRARAILAAAWGFPCGLGYYSFFEQLRRSVAGDPDPSGLPPVVMIAIKAAGLLLATTALVATLLSDGPGAARPSGDASGSPARR